MVVEVQQQTATPPPPPVEVLETNHDFTMATCGAVFIVLFHNETSLEAAATLERLFANFTHEFPGAALLTVVEEGAPMPTTAAREALADFMQNAAAIQVSGVAYEGTGFRAAAVRSVVTGLTMLARQPYPHKVFATVETTCQWLSDIGLERGLALPSGPRLSESIARARRDLGR